jgi:hypothetical protein
MTDIIDLSLLKESRTVLQRLLKERGLAYFLAKDGHRLFSLEKEKVELVLNASMAKLSREGHDVHPKSIEHARAQVRRELIQRVTQAMMQVGY